MVHNNLWVGYIRQARGNSCPIQKGDYWP